MRRFTGFQAGPRGGAAMGYCVALARLGKEPMIARERRTSGD